ncbi:hypothetical protein RHMOL_Rhmol08G0254800 [Rhododendron molle]|uniref:Uncharacterized protein n=2 Tax=Rhododendron molle TaxID=49168 RepID=A0ACC0MTN3_RHOML|nr:hypothetical protein RHMOL_Rhmol08G0254800 [Rhododendron molle]KAI8543909.1 hypothetical protein RHMOL_Rhmol08G0254800 [Rhododendron molle]
MVVLKSGKRSQSSLEKAVLKSKKRQRECSSSSDWSTLPGGILDLILNRLIQLSDYLHFLAVCKPWLGCRPSQGSPWQRTSQPGSSVFVDTFIQSESGGEGGGGRTQETLQRYAKKGSQHRATSSLSSKKLWFFPWMVSKLGSGGSEHYTAEPLLRVKFYVVDIDSRVLSLDVSKSNAQVIEVAPRIPTRLDKSYIVESSSGADLLLVQRYLFRREEIFCPALPNEYKKTKEFAHARAHASSNLDSANAAVTLFLQVTLLPSFAVKACARTGLQFDIRVAASALI